jgi:hypothetical protein
MFLFRKNLRVHSFFLSMVTVLLQGFVIPVQYL